MASGVGDVVAGVDEVVVVDGGSPETRSVTEGVRGP